MTVQRGHTRPAEWNCGRTGARQKGSGGALGTNKTRNLLQVTLGVVSLLLATNAFCYYDGAQQSWWGTPVCVLGCTTICLLVTWLSSSAGYFSWANIFLVLLALFHLGYYVPVRLGLARPLSYMPPVSSATGDLAMLLYCCAALSFALGAATSEAWSRRGPETTDASATDDPRLIWGVEMSGILVSALSVLMLGIYLFQVGGVANLFTLSYAAFWHFINSSDPRFLSTFISFMPVGLLLLYVSLFAKRRSGRALLILDAASALYIVWLTLIGARGPAFLFVLAALYVRHACRSPLSWKVVAAAAGVLLLLIPLVRAYRNVPAAEREAAIERGDITPLSGIMEMGGTYRTLYGFAYLFAPGGYRPMLGTSYLIAAEHVIPNIGAEQDSVPISQYYRSNVWITDVLAPRTANAGIGLGSTGIGEPFANFGYPGIALLFTLLGLAISLLERHVFRSGSVVSAAVAASAFIPVNWYIRDDAYGTLRPAAWPLAAICLAYFTCKAMPRPRGTRGIRPIRGVRLRAQTPARV